MVIVSSVNRQSAVVFWCGQCVSQFTSARHREQCPQARSEYFCEVDLTSARQKRSRRQRDKEATRRTITYRSAISDRENDRRASRPNDVKRMADTKDDCADNVQFFEGVEKLLEIWFTSTKNLKQPQGDLRHISR